MAKCKSCGKSGLFIKLDNMGRCKKCSQAVIDSLSNGGMYTKTADQLRKLTDPTYQSKRLDLKQQDALLNSLWKARDEYKREGDINKLIAVYEYAMIDAKPVLQNAQSHVFYLVDLYIKTNQNDKAWGYLESISFEYIHETHKIRMYQFKILKKEKRYTDALIFLMEAYLLKSQFTNTFNEEGFIKDATSTINKLKWDINKVDYLTKLIKDQVDSHNFDQQLLRSKYRSFLEELK